MRLLLAYLMVCFGLFSATLVQAASYPMTGAPVPGYSQFDSHFVALMKKWQMKGAAVAVIKRGQIIYSRGFGYANVAQKKPVQPDSLFRVASISKAITASAVLNLVQQNKLKLTDKVYPLLGLTPLPGQTLTPGVNQISVGDLLSMTAGWGRWFDPMFGPWPHDYVTRLGQTPPVDCSTAARFMMSEPMPFKPGTTFVYANINYCLLGLVIQKVSGLSYTQYLQTVILQPIGVTDMQIANTQLGQQNSREVTYYPMSPAPVKATDTLLPIAGLPYGNNQLLMKNASEGGWVASAPDLAQWADALRSGKMLNRQLITAMLSPPPGAKIAKVKKGQKASHWTYGMGWFLPAPGKATVYYTHGSFTGTNGIIFWRKDGTILVALFNSKPDNYTGVQSIRNQIRSLFLKYVP